MKSFTVYCLDFYVFMTVLLKHMFEWVVVCLDRDHSKLLTLSVVLNSWTHSSMYVHLSRLNKFKVVFSPHTVLVLSAPQFYWQFNLLVPWKRYRIVFQLSDAKVTVCITRTLSELLIWIIYLFWEITLTVDIS